MYLTIPSKAPCPARGERTPGYMNEIATLALPPAGRLAMTRFRRRGGNYEGGGTAAPFIIPFSTQQLSLRGVKPSVKQVVERRGNLINGSVAVRGLI
jgi:hypothetical protein